jgi:hypothetical protein
LQNSCSNPVCVQADAASAAAEVRADEEAERQRQFEAEFRRQYEAHINAMKAQSVNKADTAKADAAKDDAAKQDTVKAESAPEVKEEATGVEEAQNGTPALHSFGPLRCCALLW